MTPQIPLCKDIALYNMNIKHYQLILGTYWVMFVYYYQIDIIPLTTLGESFSVLNSLVTLVRDDPYED